MEAWELNVSGQRLPTSVPTGCLVSGKTTVLNHLIHQPALSRPHVLINELGEIGLDHDLMTCNSSDIVIEMANGCLGCTIRVGLANALREVPACFAREGIRLETVALRSTGIRDNIPAEDPVEGDEQLTEAVTR